MKATRSGVIMAVLLAIVALAHAQGTQLLISNVLVQQRPFTAIWEITYDLETVDDLPVWVSLFLSTDEGLSYPHLCATVTGDVGDGVLPGASRHIVWNSGADFASFRRTTCKLRVTADDGIVHFGDFVYVAPGTFTMGSPPTEPARESNATQHQVTLTHGMYVQTTEVTNQQYMEMAQWAYDHGYVTVTSGSVMYDNLDGSAAILKYLGAGGYEISFSDGVFSCINPDHPAMWVSWFGSVAYCDWLSLKQGLPRAYNHGTWACDGGSPYTAVGYRLPTEAEWEYACRAGSTTAFANGAITYIDCAPLDPNLDLMGWYCGNASWTHPVAQKPPNAWDLYDMHGNVFEWCNDRYGPYGGTETDPVGPGSGIYRVSRGGGVGAAIDCRSAARSSYYTPGNAESSFGFRPVRSAN